MSEEGVLIRAMRDANVPKFLKDDLPLFSALVQDLFPDAEIAEVKYGNLEKVTRKCLVDKDFIDNPKFNLKII
jgi:dynein heavy chain, axonemal